MKLKITALLLALSFAAFPAFSQEAKWIEMENFHTIMSVSFHPAEENDLKPVRKNSAELVAKAKAWQSAVVPAGFNGEVTKPILDKLVKQCELIHAKVADKTDAQLKVMITEAHDIFHEIKEKCRK